MTALTTPAMVTILPDPPAPPAAMGLIAGSGRLPIIIAQGLKSMGENLYLQTDASGPPVLGVPGEDQRGSLKQKFVENSNVDPTVELINLIKTQRAFEMNSNTVRTADETLRTVATLKR